MPYKALYRSYRPTKFSEVAGQEHIIKTLQNALKNDKVAHAYLFSGPRGTGKTTIAKILAKGVNCEKGYLGDSCGECEICKGINDGSISDIIEIDAASNNGVDEIREIRDKVKYMPSVCKYKVYIIDEVHMLSTGAFNALLKTLEEPPKHVIFILATTEPYKIPATIISRCQRFDFRSISLNDIENYIKKIVLKEKIKITEEAISVIAKSAEGGMRDALSLLDQVYSYADGEITEEDVHKVNGSVSTNSLLDLVKSLIDKDNINSLNILKKLIDDGKEITRIVNDLIQFYRDLLLYKNVKNIDDDKSLFKMPEFIEVAKRISNQRIYYFLDILNETQNNIKWTNQKREYLELALIKMTDDIELKEVLVYEKINELEKRIKELEEKPVLLNAEKTEIKSQKVKKISDDNSNIQIVEKILINANKEMKTQIQKGWEHLLEIDDNMTIKMLHRGNLVAFGDNKMILEYPDLASCNHMLKKKNKEYVLQILNRKSHIVDDYITVTEEEWKEIRETFKKQWNEGNKKPDLSTIRLSAIGDLEIDVDIKKEKNASDLAKEFFGEDIIKIMEER